MENKPQKSKLRFEVHLHQISQLGMTLNKNMVVVEAFTEQEARDIVNSKFQELLNYKQIQSAGFQQQTGNGPYARLPLKPWINLSWGPGIRNVIISVRRL
jgi:hypothetical protein